MEQVPVPQLDFRLWTMFMLDAPPSATRTQPLAGGFETEPSS